MYQLLGDVQIFSSNSQTVNSPAGTRWYVKFTIKKQEFSEEYKEHLTKTIL